MRSPSTRVALALVVLIAAAVPLCASAESSLTREQVDAMDTKELKAFLKRKGAECIACAQKSDFEERVWEVREWADKEGGEGAKVSAETGTDGVKVSAETSKDGVKVSAEAVEDGVKVEVVEADGGEKEEEEAMGEDKSEGGKAAEEKQTEGKKKHGKKHKKHGGEEAGAEGKKKDKGHKKESGKKHKKHGKKHAEKHAEKKAEKQAEKKAEEKPADSKTYSAEPDGKKKVGSSWYSQEELDAMVAASKQRKEDQNDPFIKQFKEQMAKQGIKVGNGDIGVLKRPGDKLPFMKGAAKTGGGEGAKAGAGKADEKKGEQKTEL